MKGAQVVVEMDGTDEYPVPIKADGSFSYESELLNDGLTERDFNMLQVRANAPNGVTGVSQSLKIYYDASLAP